jgi:CBS domain containing-hemolysin-like protein
MAAWTPALVLLVLIGFSALAAGAEISLLSLNPVRLESAARKGSRLARLQASLRRNPQRMFTTILIIGNLLNAALTTYAAVVSTDILAPALGLTRDQALLLNALVAAAIIIVLCDLIPKTVGAVRPEKFSALITLPVAIADKLFAPVHWLMGWTVTPLLRLLTGGRTEVEHAMSRDEMATALTMALAGGRLHKMDAEVAKEALEFSQKDVRDVMTPRVDVAAVPESASLGEALTLMSDSGFTRLPVYHDSIDEIAGVLLVKDLIRESTRAAQLGKDPFDEWANNPVTPLMRRVLHFPATKSIVEALNELRQDRSHLAVVVDEHGGTAGIVTLEDILEELVGDIRDEYDTEQTIDVVRRGENYLIVSGRARLDVLEELGLEGVETETSTLGGLLMERLGRAVSVGDVLEIDGLRIIALKVIRNRIKLLRVEKME